MSDETEQTETTEPAHEDGQRQSRVDALLRERAGYERRGLTDRAKGVDAELKAAGYSAPAGRRAAAQDKA